MKKFLIGLAAGIVLSGLVVLALILGVLAAGERAPHIEDGSTLVVGLRGGVPEAAPVPLPFRFLDSSREVTVQELREVLRAAALDRRIKAAVVAPEGVREGWGKLEEIRDGLLHFRASGKPLIAWLRNPGGREYYLATAAGEIYMAPEDVLNVKGLRAEAVFLRGTLDKLGIQVEIEHAGRYKDAGDTFTRRSMREETREVLNSILDEMYKRFVAAVAGARKRTPDEIRAAIDQGPFLAGQAKEHGLVDELLYEDQVFDRLKERLGQEELKKISHTDYNLARRPAGRHRIAFVVASGTILRGSGGDGLAGDGILWSRRFIRLLREVAGENRIEGVILRIDSPGGDAIASDEILREARLLSEKKPLVISMSDVAASGGYYIAMTGDPVVAYPGTFTGSIGVLFGKANLRGLYDKIGVTKESLSRGRFADIDSDYRPLSEAERKKLREGIEATYRSFLARVAEGRGRKTEEIEPLAEGRVWLGVQAREIGLVDELGGLDRAIELVKEKAGIPAGETIRLVAYPPKQSFWEYLLKRRGEAALTGQLRDILGGVDPRIWLEGGLLRLMPYTVEVR